MRISDVIAQYIEQELARAKGTVRLSRSELAEQFNCVPSQINYVLTTRFSPERGYTVDSRRGGGGYIMITRVKLSRGMLMMHVLNAIGESLDAQSAAAFLSNMSAAGALDESEALVIAAATSDRALFAADRELRDRLRASILKRCLAALQ